MANKLINLPEPDDEREVWAQALKDLDAEIAASATLTEEEKLYLLVEMDQLSDEEWEPINVIGEPVSETIIQDRR